MGGYDGQLDTLSVRPTPVIPGVSPSVFVGSTTTPSFGGDWPPAGREVVLPRDEFLVRTVLQSNMTLLHNRIEDFKTAMEANLTSLYRNAYDHKRYTLKR